MKISFIISLYFILINVSFGKGDGIFRYDQDIITKRKTLKDAYARFGKSYQPYLASQSNLDPKIAEQLQELFSLTDMAVIEKVLLLEFIGKIYENEIPEDTPYRDYYEEIISHIKKMPLEDPRLIKIRIDLIKGINHHREVLDSWLEAARRQKVHKVKNASGRWVHYGTAAGDKIFYDLYHKYIVVEFKEENPENLHALSRHLCVLVF